MQLYSECGNGIKIYAAAAASTTAGGTGTEMMLAHIMYRYVGSYGFADGTSLLRIYKIQECV